MTQRQISLGKTSKELEKTLCYAVERQFSPIEFKLERRDDNSSDLVFHLNPTQEKMAPEIEAFVQKFCKTANKIGSRAQSEVLWKTNSAPTRALNLLDSVKIAAWQTEIPGVMLLKEKMESVALLLDRAFLKFAKSISAESVKIPSLLTKETLEKAGYWQRDTQQLSTIRQHISPGSEHVCLSPAACLPLYPVLGKEGFSKKVYTSLCQVYRWEGGVFPKQEPLSRLWEYRVREIVAFGNEEDLSIIQAKYIQFLKKMGELLKLSCEICTASDSFFHAESVNLAIYQLMNQTKLEFRVLFQDSGLAVSSFNFHAKHFTDTFSTNHNPQKISSACIGFGIERFAYAVVAKMEQDPTLTLESLASLECNA